VSKQLLWNSAKAALIATTLAVLLTAAQARLTPDQEQLLAAARVYALHYSASLPDFLCTQIVHRSEDRMDNGRWRDLDTLNIKLSYSGHKEDYKLMEVNGKPTLLDYRNVGGAVSTGEFGSRLYAIFAPQSGTEFAWKGWSHVRRRRVAVFTYRISLEKSTYGLQFGPVPVGPNAMVIGYHGEVSIDPVSNTVLRQTLEGDIPMKFPITACSSWVEYDYRDVAGSSYLVPVAAQTTLASGRYRASNRIEFQEYRKFGTETTITFK
jgi:hypothetical protein